MVEFVPRPFKLGRCLLIKLALDASVSIEANRAKRRLDGEKVATEFFPIVGGWIEAVTNIKVVFFQKIHY